LPQSSDSSIRQPGEAAKDGTKPWRATKAEQLLKGRASADLFNAAAAAALEDAKAHTYNGFKIELAKRILIRALTIAGGTA
jgi:xanthine dehydrogenase YagS FAD-binding subunit